MAFPVHLFCNKTMSQDKYPVDSALFFKYDISDAQYNL